MSKTMSEFRQEFCGGFPKSANGNPRQPETQGFGRGECKFGGSLSGSRRQDELRDKKQSGMVVKEECGRSAKAERQ